MVDRTISKSVFPNHKKLGGGIPICNEKKRLKIRPDAISTLVPKATGVIASLRRRGRTHYIRKALWWSTSLSNIGAATDSQKRRRNQNTDRNKSNLVIAVNLADDAHHQLIVWRLYPNFRPSYTASIRVKKCSLVWRQQCEIAFLQPSSSLSTSNFPIFR